MLPLANATDDDLLAAEGARRFAVPLFATQVVMAAALSGGVDRTVLLVWVIVAGLNAVRLYLVNEFRVRRIKNGTFEPLKPWNVFIQTLLSAGVWGVLPVLADRYGSESLAMLGYLAVLGAAFGAVLSTPTSRLHFRAAIVGFVAPTVVATVTGVLDAWWFMALTVAFGVFVVYVHNHLNRLVVEHTAATAENRRLAAELADALHTEDRATGVANRVGYDRWLRRHDGQPVVVDVIDIERLDELRWLHGHDQTDQILATFASSVDEILGNDGLIARLTDRRFVIARLGSPDDVFEAQCESDQGRGSSQVEIRTVSRAITTTDAALVDLDETTNEGVESRLAAASSSGPNAVQRQLLAEIPTAIAEGFIEPWFQPIVDVSNGRITGWEALVRWNHPRLGLVAPETLLPIVSASGSMRALTRSVIDRAVEFASSVVAAGHGASSTMHVNIDPTDLRPGLHPGVIDALVRHGLPADRLVLEITESHVIGIDAVVLGELEALRTDGVRIAVDDFGTGFSSLSHLLDLPIDCVKIDRRFVREAGEHGSVMRAVLGLAQGLGLATVAEGVESDEQLAMLGALGCDDFQGFLVSPAVTPSAALELLNAVGTSAPGEPARHIAG
ncbi:MAG: EAL domain-containing protein [Ilumatobacter sp.]